jgi:hypothetical protein
MARIVNMGIEIKKNPWKRCSQPNPRATEARKI